MMPSTAPALDRPMEKLRRCNDTALLILNYKKFDDTINFLRSIIRHEVDDADIIVLDNDSQNGAVNAIRDWVEENLPSAIADTPGATYFTLDDARFSQHVEFVHSQGRVSVFKSNTNLGFSGGNNALSIIARALGYDYLFFLNSDVEFCDKFTVRKLKACHVGMPEVYLSGPCIINKNGTFDSPFKRDTYWGDLLFYPFVNYARRLLGLPIVQFDMKALSEPEGAEVYKISGAAMFFPSERFFEIRMLDESVWLSCEEAILAEKILQRGGKTIFLPTTVMLHLKASAPREKTRRADVLRNHFDQRNYFYKNYRHYGPIRLLFLVAVQKLRVLLAHL